MDVVVVVVVVVVAVLVVLFFVAVLCFVKEPRAVREPDRCGAAFVVRVVVVGVGLVIEKVAVVLALALVPALALLAPAAAAPVMDATVLFRRAEVLFFLRVEAALWGRCFLLTVVSVVVTFLTTPFSFLEKYP